MGVSAHKVERMEALQRRIEERKGPPVFFELPIGAWFFFEERIYRKTTALTGVETGEEAVRHFRLDQEVAW
jgi:hypothetical protein